MSHFASRIKSPFEDNLLFGSSTSFFNAPYGDYWKFMKKICTTELLGTRQMKKLKNVRREEVVKFLNKMLEIGKKNEVTDLSVEVLTVANNGTCRMIMSARCSGEDNQAEKCRALVSESFDLAAKLALFNVFGPLKRIGIWYLRKKIDDVPKSVTAMVQCFDWKVVGGDGPDGSKVNMDTKAGVVKSMAKPFMAIPVLHRNLFSA
ncbi:CYTOCHROME P450 FAMILY 705 SUBFAMILY A POLYPEPTIDE 25-RELATED [Salix purpurea]|uniref:CYTOCHROME P450 FAMILY 705 SUBFAMILY A POLYPEPTIDE 25-RELATED n=1 Tax=Salix purpurea TaxID=77065 RepID=A0A9Q0SWC8_SALPP|nr:CYTOCHROME P450 FAMILY 705 SUBFAMILY A POLYPEPTIDE 25-RELATED [Salix purpurea]